MNKVIVLLAGLLGVASLWAQGATPAYSVAVDFPYVSKYVFRGLEVTKDAIQPSIVVTSGSFNGGVWTSQPVTKNADNEFDFFGNYDIPINKDWKTTLGATLYYYPELDASTGLKRSTFEPKLALSGPLGPVASTFSVYYDTTLKNTTLEGVFGYSAPMEQGGKDTLDFSGAYGYVSPDVGNTYSYWSLSAKVSFKPSDKLTGYVGATYASNNLSGAKDGLLYGIAGVTVSF